MKKIKVFALSSLLLCFACVSDVLAYPVTFRVTQGAEIRAFRKVRHFYPFTEYPLTKTGTEDGYDVYAGELPTTFHYEAGGGENTDFLKQARVTALRLTPEEQVFTVDMEKLDAARRVDNGYKSDGVYLNVNDAQHLELKKGETFKLLPIRVWQAMEGEVDNYFIEPDYDIEILGDRGALEYEWKGSPGSRYAELRGLAEGVAVLRIAYAPLKLIHRNGENHTYFNATDPIETGIVVVSVVDASVADTAPGFNTNIAAREYDTVYFDRNKTDHAEYVFKPSGAEAEKFSVRVHRPIHRGGAVWGEGWSDGREGADGFTVDLYEGRNIVETFSPASRAFPGGKKYHVVNAKGIAVNVTDRNGAPLRPGDELEISFDGIKTPLEKIAAIYNPGYTGTCYVSYRTPDGGEARSGGVQYNLSEKNAVSVTVPASGAVRLTGGVIHCEHLGDPLGSHRDPNKVLGNGLKPQLDAVAVQGVYSVLPDISLDAEGADDTDKTGGGSGGGCDAGGLGLIALLVLSVVLAGIRGRSPR